MRKKIMILMVVLSLGLFGCAGQSGNTVNSDNETTITDPVNNIPTEMTPTPESTSTPTLTPTPTPFEIVPKEVDIDTNDVVFQDPSRDYWLRLDEACYYNFFDEEYCDYYGIDDDALCAFVLERGIYPLHSSETYPKFKNNEELFRYVDDEAKMFEQMGLKCCYAHAVQIYRGYWTWYVSVIATKQQIKEVFGGENLRKTYNNTYWFIMAATREEFYGQKFGDQFKYIKHAKLLDEVE